MPADAGIDQIIEHERLVERRDPLNRCHPVESIPPCRLDALNIRNGQWPSTRPRCDLIVCWEHNWPGVPEKLTVLEFRKVFGIGWSAWLQPMHSEYADSVRDVPLHSSSSPDAGSSSCSKRKRSSSTSSLISRTAAPSFDA